MFQTTLPSSQGLNLFMSLKRTSVIKCSLTLISSYDENNGVKKYIAYLGTFKYRGLWVLLQWFSQKLHEQPT